MIITVDQLKSLTFPKNCPRCLRPASESLSIGGTPFLTRAVRIGVAVGVLALITVMAPYYQESLGFAVLFVLIAGALLLAAQLLSRPFDTERSPLVVVPICSRCLARRRFAAVLGGIAAWAFVTTYPFGMYFNKAGYPGPAVAFNLVWTLGLVVGALTLYFPRPLLRVPRAGKGRVDLEAPRHQYARLLKDANPDVLGAAHV